MRGWAFALAGLIAAPALAADTGANVAVAQVAHGFYTAYRALPAGGGVSGAVARATLLPFLSPALGKLLAEAEAAEALWAKKTKGEVPPLVEGDPFTSNFEGATWFKIGVCAGDANAGHCAVALSYGAAPYKPTDWTDTTLFVMTKDGWRLDDIVYGGTWDFANKGRLTELLANTIEQSKGPAD
jgi:hypothetical protein